MAAPRKSILKVHFDVEPPANPVSESITEPSMYIPGDLQEPLYMDGDVTLRKPMSKLAAGSNTRTTDDDDDDDDFRVFSQSS